MRDPWKTARFEQDKPADPTENMSQEDAQKWKDMNEEHRDNFKTASMYYTESGQKVLRILGNMAKKLNVSWGHLSPYTIYAYNCEILVQRFCRDEERVQEVIKLCQPFADKIQQIANSQYTCHVEVANVPRSGLAVNFLVKGPFVSVHKTAFVHAKPTKAIMDELFKEADGLYDARVPFRYLIDTLQDLYGDPTGLNDFPGYNNPAVKKVRDCMQELDRQIGDTARQMENLARQMRETVKTAKALPKGDFALVQSKGMDDVVLSVHKTQDEAEKAMRKHGGEPGSLDARGMRVVNVGPKGKAELLETFGKLTVRPKTASEMPSKGRLEGVLDSIEKNIKDIRHHLGKAEDTTPYDDIATLLHSIQTAARVMERRLGDKTANLTPAQAHVLTKVVAEYFKDAASAEGMAGWFTSVGNALTALGAIFNRVPDGHTIGRQLLVLSEKLQGLAPKGSQEDLAKQAAEVDPKQLERKVKRVLASGGYTYDVFENYSGRGMFGRYSLFAFSTDADPRSGTGAKLIRMGFTTDSLGRGYIYYSRALAPLEVKTAASDVWYKQTFDDEVLWFQNTKAQKSNTGGILVRQSLSTHAKPKVTNYSVRNMTLWTSVKDSDVPKEILKAAESHQSKTAWKA